MPRLKQSVRRGIEKVFRPISYQKSEVPFRAYESLAAVRGTESDPSSLIAASISEGRPLCITRFGRTELQVAQRWKSKNLGGVGWQTLDSLATGDPYFYFSRATTLLEGTGIRPMNAQNAERFYDLTIDCLGSVDILGSWAPGEAWFGDELQKARIVTLMDLEPYRSERPWSSSLQHRSVLVVHPYAESITSQYKQHGDALFGFRGVLPDFALSTYVPPQAYFGEVPDADAWFTQLERMVADLADLRFDVAIIGAGPFGMPLAAAVKRMGRQAIHLGGATQLLFGILGSRWINDPGVRPLINTLWTRPLPQETPEIATQVERSAYW